MGNDAKPWDDWIPGVLSKRQVKLLVKEGFVEGVARPAKDIDASSLDLTLSSKVYHLPDGAIKPSGSRYQDELDLFGKPVSLVGGKVTLDARQTYVVELRERIRFAGERIFGMATAKSSVGRIDVLARLVVDGMNCYEYFSPAKTLSGSMYLEITPLTFSVRIRPGISLSQLRLFYGDPEACKLSGNEANATFLKNSTTNDGTLSVDLDPVAIAGTQVIGFRAKDNEALHLDPIPLWGKGLSAASQYWHFEFPTKTKRLRLKKNAFYILRSKEWLALPRGVAVYCRANDESFGEMRIHYAGFAHPMFGRTRDDQVGTPLIFEVRGHDVNVSLQDSETMARLIFYKMSEDAAKRDASKDYELQRLQLSKFFSAWPTEADVDSNGTVQLLA